jgi:hypothetical protein
VTYPHPEVAAELAAHFVCARVDIVADRQAARQARLLWTPWLAFWSRHEVKLRDVIGFQPPDVLPWELRLVRALDALRRADYAAATALFLQVSEAEPARELRPEAAYWVGIAGYLQDADEERLHRTWRPLRERWPESIWAARTGYREPPR